MNPVDALDPGDFFLVQRHGPISIAIRLITRSEVSHAGIVIEPGHEHGYVLEALAKGASYTPVSAFDGVQLVGTGRLPLTGAQRDRVEEVAKSLHGTGYGFLDILSVGLLQYHLRPEFLKRRVQRQKRLICSQLVDVFLQRLDFHVYDDGRWPGDVTPGDLLWTAITSKWVT
jgi:hypothetical protein